MAVSEIDGINVYKDYVDSCSGLVYFDDWLRQNGEYSQERLRINLIEDGLSEDEIEDTLGDYWEDFSIWCDDNSNEELELIPQTV